MKKTVLGSILGLCMVGVVVYLVIYQNEIYKFVSGFIVGCSLMQLGKYIAGKFIDED